MEVRLPTMTEKSQETHFPNSIPVFQEKKFSLQNPTSIHHESKCPPRKLPQYIASLAATIAALAVGLVVGWTSPAGNNGINLGGYPFTIGPNEFSWISSVFHLGAAVICIPAGMLADFMGRRRTMLMLVVPYTIGWACIIWPNCVATLIFGRLVLGASSGSSIVIVPMYTAEIADPETRGRLGSYFELLYCMGILGAYTLGLFDDMFALSLISATVPIIFFVIFLFMPETPTYYLMHDNVDAARKTLIWLRGSHYDVETELAEEIEGQKKVVENGEEISFFTAIRSRAAVKGLVIGYGLMFFQQCSGITAIVCYASGILASDNAEHVIWPTIVVGVMQTSAVFMGSLVVDKWGRRPLLLTSGTAMCVMTLVLGLYFYLDENAHSMSEFRWLPLTCICVFVVFSSFGFGPIPVMMASELFAPQIKGIAMSGTLLFNRLIAFVVTKCYMDVRDAVGSCWPFWIFSIICAISVVFVAFVVPETKNKTLEQIQIELSRGHDSDRDMKKLKEIEKT